MERQGETSNSEHVASHVAHVPGIGASQQSRRPAVGDCQPPNAPGPAEEAKEHTTSAVGREQNRGTAPKQRSKQRSMGQPARTTMAQVRLE